jgi:hypothetical protein
MRTSSPLRPHTALQEDALLKELFFQYEAEPDAVERIVADEKLPVIKNTRGRVRARLQQLGLLQIIKMKKLTECVLRLTPVSPCLSPNVLWSGLTMSTFLDSSSPAHTSPWTEGEKAVVQELWSELTEDIPIASKVIMESGHYFSR